MRDFTKATPVAITDSYILATIAGRPELTGQALIELDGVLYLGFWNFNRKHFIVDASGPSQEAIARRLKADNYAAEYAEPDDALMMGQTLWH